MSWRWFLKMLREFQEWSELEIKVHDVKYLTMQIKNWLHHIMRINYRIFIHTGKQIT